MGKEERVPLDHNSWQRLLLYIMKGIATISLLVISMLASSEAHPNPIASPEPGPVAAPLPGPAAEPFGPIARGVVRTAIRNRVANRVYNRNIRRGYGHGGYGHGGYGYGGYGK